MQFETIDIYFYENHKLYFTDYETENCKIALNFGQANQKIIKLPIKIHLVLPLKRFALLREAVHQRDFYIFDNKTDELRGVIQLQENMSLIQDS